MGSVASVLLNQRLHYRPELFRQGLEKCGYSVSFKYEKPRHDSVLVTWNRMPRDEQYIRSYESKGRPVLISENAWIGPENKEGHFFALCRNRHNGPGTWYVGEEKRFPQLGIELKPWRTGGDNILVLPQRGIGEPGIAMPRDWTQRIVNDLKKITDRPVEVRNHPGRRPHPPLEPALENVHAVVTWASGAAIKALIAGVPVFYCLKRWIGGGAAKYGIDDIENPFLGDREPMLERLAWAQWSGEEIASGEPFRCLLQK